MVHVALAGAGGFGLTLLKAILASGKHTVTVLSRSHRLDLASLGANVIPVEYTKHDQLVRALQGVHTLISTIAAFSGDFTSSQIALIEAAKEAGVKRFAPSEFAHGGYEGIDLFAPKRPVWEAAKASALEVTRFNCGIFMNLFGTGTPKGEEEALAGLRPWNFVVNMMAGTADLPGDGSQLLTFTEIGDVCRFVVAILEAEKWELDSNMVGQNASFRDAVKVIEKFQKRNFLVRENSVEGMRGLAGVQEKRFYNQVRLVIAKGGFELRDDLNRKFPEIRPMGIEEYLEKWWGGVELPEAKWEEDRVFGFEK